MIEIENSEHTQDLANAIRVLSMDAVQAANSGHPGAPMGMAEMAVALWKGHLKHNPANPNWADRDRFVLSNGHASMLIYSLLHLAGYDLPLEEIKNFRQLHSKTPGHPECDVTPGVETTTGPLGQGISNAVGMALAEMQLAAEFNREDHWIVDHYTYVFLGDGCLMEGISHEVCSLAGTLRLSKLIALYDDNGISIDGDVEGWFADDTPARFEAYGWNVIRNVDGHNAEEVYEAIGSAREQGNYTDGKPTLICCKTAIGKGAPNKEGGHDVHGAPLGEEEIAAAKALIGWGNEPFHVPAEVKSAWSCLESGSAAEAEWNARFAAYETAHPELAAEFKRRMAGEFPADYSAKLQAALAETAARTDSVATRKASQQALDILGPLLPEMFGGSADLTGSNLTNYKGVTTAARDQPGKHMSYGVREFGMAAMMNGMALHGGYIPYGGTFLTFSDYSRNALRMSALMKLRTIHVFTHDSIGLGEDGPTHQSVEHVPSLRIIPGLDMWRPADPYETLVAWSSAVARADGPSALALSRQGTPALTGAVPADTVAKGGYVLRDSENPVAVIIGTGTELALAVEAAEQLAAEGVAVRVVSMPSTNVFDRQSVDYQDSVLPANLPGVVVEAAHGDLWHKYVGRNGVVVGINRFGESAPAGELYKHFGITADAVVAAVKKVAG
ncbi:MAG: transketolase [Gammaproteobacteria bacterium]|nr:transketolase [Gammaproteobacteria bacterium]